MNKIIPHLWYDTAAREARDLYCRVFNQETVGDTFSLEGTPSGKVDMVDMRLFGQDFSMISAGPFFKFNPSISFLVNCASEEEVRRYWDGLSPGAEILMPYGDYPFSKAYGWLADRYGLSWQIYLGERAAQKIIPTLMFVGEQCGRAEEAVRFYTSVFGASSIGAISRYGKDLPADKEGSILHVDFTLEGLSFAAMDSGDDHRFGFNEAVSFIVECENQEEVDYFWGKMSAHPDSEQCGWLKDSFGVSWQIVPRMLQEILKKSDGRKRQRITETFLGMKKLEIGKLQAVYDEE